LLNALIWVTGHCNRAAVSRNRYGVEKTVDTHTILINAITLYPHDYAFQYMKSTEYSRVNLKLADGWL
jgi:formate-dependent phosphoribosylglycinamide formyltransferase (GAR transformylase)